MPIESFVPSMMVDAEAGIPAGLERASAALRVLSGGAEAGVLGASSLQSFDDDLWEIVSRTAPGAAKGGWHAGAEGADGHWVRWLAAVREASEAVSEAYLARGREAFEPDVPELRARAARRFADSIFWRAVDCMEPSLEVWTRLVEMLDTEARGNAGHVAGDLDGIGQQCLRAMACHSALLDQLTLPGALIVSRLIDLSLPFLSLGRQWGGKVGYRLAAHAPAVPRRVLRSSGGWEAGWFFEPQPAVEFLDSLARQLSSGRVPAALSGHDPELSCEAVRHLLMVWSAEPPVRRCTRHPVRGRLHFVRGFEAAADVLCGGEPGLPRQGYVGDMSRSGVGMSVRIGGRDALPHYGDLLSFQFDDASRWQVGVVKRVRFRGPVVDVGVDTLSLSPMPVKVDNGQRSFEALLCDRGTAGEAVRLIARPGCLDPGVQMFMRWDGRVFRLRPMGSAMRGTGFELRAYQIA